MLEEKEEEKKEENYKFKARPYSKSQSEEKYRQFMANLEAKKREIREKEDQIHMRSQKEIERLMNETKLFK
jgi:hypothetical protein